MSSISATVFITDQRFRRRAATSINQMDLIGIFLVLIAVLCTQVFPAFRVSRLPIMVDNLSKNQAHFNEIAGQYDQKHASAIVQLERQIHARLGFIGMKPGSRFLDYACGTGMLSRVLAETVTESIGIDVTENMVHEYNAQAQREGVTAARSAFVGNLADPSDAAPSAFSGTKFFSFDVAGVGLGFHHFDDCELAAKRLAARLKPGGVFFIVDFSVHAETNAEYASRHGISHHGFSKDQIAAIFTNAGVGGEFAFEEFAEPIVFETIHGEGAGHEDAHAHTHAHDHEHDSHHHEKQEGYRHGNGHAHGPSRKVFIARGSKL
ncbi:S-adenosyl-L-methionine-dependent methyltransferase [Dactylonectria macrodidyma]|uniref:S-adenosyl-L-methionine-dependent methyltransferase n=1 Tax=Dactylonectria macrodidyma TaxID=307937 RepID=A0A9P9FW84_9HYPO|nr:S-adenosyl-L-methionine-dependent methyltransferase [Dactylonectria macrodidyma]